MIYALPLLSAIQYGKWINADFPMYGVIDYKPDNGCKIRDASNGKSGITMCLRRVKNLVEEEANSL